MAGKGPVRGAGRKPPEQRRRRNVEAPSTVLPAAGYQGEYPALPVSWRNEVTEWERDPETREKYPVTRVLEVEYCEEAREWYETFARSPVAARFTTTDWRRLRDLAPLKDRYYRGDHGLASEIRLQESLLGATVKDRQSAHLVVGEPEDVEPERPKLAEVRRLRAVDPGA